jgi:hypothetical protein
MPHKADTSVICQCGAIINKYYYRTHIQTAKHAREMIGRENIEVAEAWKYNHQEINIKNVLNRYYYI